MQELLAELLWRNFEVDKAADRLRKTLPGFPEAQQDYEDLTEQIRSIAGPDLYDQFYNCFMCYTGYEVQAYYALGLGLRGALARELGLHSPK